METIGFIGLGNMGGGMSLNIQRAGYPLVVYDLREEAARPLLEGGARLANTPAEVSELSDITFTSLPGPKEVEAVALAMPGCWRASGPAASMLTCPPAARPSSGRLSRCSGARAPTSWTPR